MPEIYAPPALSGRWLPVWRRNFLVWRKLLAPALLGNVLEPLLYLVALGYGLGSLVGPVEGLDYFAFLASGFACASAMNTATYEGLYSVYTRMAIQQTWAAMLAAPLHVDDIVLGEMIWAGTKSLISGAVILVVASALGAVHGWQALWALPVILLTGICFGALALVVTAKAHGYDFFMYYFTLLITPMFLFSGVFFPLDGLPEGVRWVAAILPLTHAVELVRPLMTGTTPQQIALHLSVLVAYTAVSFYLATALMRRRLLV